MVVETRQDCSEHSIKSPKARYSSPTLIDCLVYSLPQITAAWLAAPMSVVQGIYAKYYGLPLTTLALVILLARTFDAITDPLIGYFSDSYRRRSGTRKPFILVGGLLTMIAGYFLYVPFDISVVYFVCCFMAFYLALTLFEIPHNAWAGELAPASEDKSKIYSVRNVASYLGLAAFYIVPLLPIFETRDITPETLEVSVGVAIVLMVPFLIICLRNSSNGRVFFTQNLQGKASSEIDNRIEDSRSHIIISIVQNKPLLTFFCSYLFYGLGIGMWYGLIFLYVDGYLGLGSQFAQMFLLAFLIGIVVTPLWCRISIEFGKKLALVFAMTLVIISFSYTGMLSPGDAGFWELAVLKVMNTLGAACLMAIAPAMLSEIIDYSAWKFRSENAATYFSCFVFITKINIALGTALGLAIAGWYGFDATTTEQSSVGIQGLMLAMVWLPIGFVFIALILIALNPIDTHRHGIIRRRLDSITRRETTQSAHNLSMSDPVIKIAKTRIL